MSKFSLSRRNGTDLMKLNWKTSKVTKLLKIKKVFYSKMLYNLNTIHFSWPWWIHKTYSLMMRLRSKEPIQLINW